MDLNNNEEIRAYVCIQRFIKINQKITSEIVVTVIIILRIHMINVGPSLLNGIVPAVRHSTKFLIIMTIPQLQDSTKGDAIL